jgi:protein phosphatase
MADTVDSFGMTHVGMVRSSNEDNFFIAELSWSLTCSFVGEGLSFNKDGLCNHKGLLMAVADGMGGHAAGKRASQLALDAIAKFLVDELNRSHLLGSSINEICDVLKRSIFVAHESLIEDAAPSPDKFAMGTTLTMVLVLWPKAYLVHIGDSRCYLFRDHELKQLTRDHTVRQLRSDLAAGMATREQTSMFENVNWLDIKSDDALWNVIAANAESVVPELTQVILRDGDTLLVCSDGLMKHMAERQIANLIDEELSAEETCQKLIAETNNKGGVDNITAILARFPKELKRSREQGNQEATSEKTAEADTLDFPSLSGQLAARANSDTAVDLEPIE